MEKQRTAKLDMRIDPKDLALFTKAFERLKSDTVNNRAKLVNRFWEYDDRTIREERQVAPTLADYQGISDDDARSLTRMVIALARQRCTQILEFKGPGDPQQSAYLDDLTLFKKKPIPKHKFTRRRK
jgi:hypothetical protein